MKQFALFMLAMTLILTGCYIPPTPMHGQAPTATFAASATIAPVAIATRDEYPTRVSTDTPSLTTYTPMSSETTTPTMTPTLTPTITPTVTGKATAVPTQSP
jgi:uncharacterized lipoprotein YajG